VFRLCRNRCGVFGCLPKSSSGLLAAIVFMTVAGPAAAAEGDEAFQIRWDNTLKYSSFLRLQGRDGTLLTDVNADDTDRNFSPGIVSSRFDLLSELDISKGRFGVDISAAAWYDSVYHQKTGNTSAATFNAASVPVGSFPREVKALHGGDAELVNAFVYGSVTLGDLPLSFRVGRHTLLWGESLFFPDNGIAGGQAPVDYIKELSGPTSYARDVHMPVAQASASLQLPDDVTLEGYYQFEWRGDREPGAGSYFDADDFIYPGAERYIVSPGQYLYRESDNKPPRADQFGAALRWTGGEVDYGVYALRFNSKSTVEYFRPGIDVDTGAVLDPTLIDAHIGKVGTYQSVYPRGIEIYGFSASGYAGSSNVAVEISTRRNMPLLSSDIFLAPGERADTDKNVRYAVGNTLHAQISSITTLGRSMFWDNATLNAEVAASQRLSVTKNKAAIDPDTNKFAAVFRATFEPTYFGVMPNLNVTPTLALGYGVIGNSSTDSEHLGGAGDLDIGVTATYRTLWSGTLMYTHYIGSPARQPLADRDFLRFTIQRTF